PQIGKNHVLVWHPFSGNGALSIRVFQPSRSGSMEDASPEMLSIFAAALEQSSPEKRAAFLDTACGADAELRQRIDALLYAHDKAGGFLQDETDAGNVAATIDVPITERPGTVIGPYKLLQPIGEGGMGTVFMAEQMAPVKRLVALKIIKAGLDSRQ